MLLDNILFFHSLYLMLIKNFSTDMLNEILANNKLAKPLAIYLSIN